jgi:hypothetical protein
VYCWEEGIWGFVFYLISSNDIKDGGLIKVVESAEMRERT